MRKSLHMLLIGSLLLTNTALADHHEDMIETKVNPQEIDGTVMVGWGSIDVKDDIVTNVMKSDDFTTLVAAVVAADLGETLMSTGPFTVFAPVNDAFAKLPEGTIEKLLMPKNKDMLADILTYHVVAGSYSSNDLKNGLELTTVQWDRIKFTYYKENWYVNNARIEMTDMYSSNGVIHTIDTVIMPGLNTEEVKKEIMTLRNNLNAELESRVNRVVNRYAEITKNLSEERKMRLNDRFFFLIDMNIKNFEENINPQDDIVNMLKLLKLEIMNMDAMASMEMNIVETAMSSSDFSTLVAAVVAADLGDTLAQAGPYTVFAPLNTAFDKLPDGTVDKLLMPENRDMLKNILTYHVVTGKYVSSDISDGTKLVTVNGEELEFTIKNGVIMANDSVITMADVETSNGVIHAIDTVLMPSE